MEKEEAKLITSKSRILASMCRRHSKFLSRFLLSLPPSLFSQDFSRVTIAFFAVSGIVLLDNEIDVRTMKSAQKWLRSLRVSAASRRASGFHGSSLLRVNKKHFEKNDDNDPEKEEDDDVVFLRCDEHTGHVAMTYSALASLKLLEHIDPDANLEKTAVHEEKVDLNPFKDSCVKESLARGVAELQQDNGGFLSSLEGGECDPRFVYCAVASLVLLELDVDKVIDVDAAVHYLLSCLSYEGAFGQAPHLEAHGGSTFCSVAALHLMKRLHVLNGRRRERLVRWLVQRFDAKEKGFAGRPNKPADTCYAFWIGATLKLLHPNEDQWDNFILQCSEFVISTSDPFTGGLAKWPDEQNAADPLHTFLGLAGLAVANHPDLRPHHPALNIVQAALQKNELEKEDEVCNGPRDLQNEEDVSKSDRVSGSDVETQSTNEVL